MGTGPELRKDIDINKTVPPYDLGGKNLSKLGRDVVPSRGWGFPVGSLDEHHDPLLNPTDTC